MRPATLSLATALVTSLVPWPATGQALGPYSYFAVTPCRVVDTRCAPGVATALCPLLAAPNGTPAIVGNGPARSFRIQGNCGVPAGAKAVSLNATVIGQTSTPGGFFLTMWPSGGAMPVVSTLNFNQADGPIANGAIVPLSTNANDLSAYIATFNTAQLILDVTGYFSP